MPAKVLTHNLWRKLRYLFVFRKPAFESLDCIDIIIDDEPLFLIVWDMRSGYYLDVEGTRKTFRYSKGAGVVKLRNNSPSVTVKAGNLWRSSKEIIPLYHYQLDDAASAELIKQLRPFRDRYINLPVAWMHDVLQIVREKVFLQHPRLTIKKISAHCKLRPVLNYAFLEFPTNN